MGKWGIWEKWGEMGKQRKWEKWGKIGGKWGKIEDLGNREKMGKKNSVAQVHWKIWGNRELENYLQGSRTLRLK